MNEYNNIKQLLERYFEGESSDADEQSLHDYFLSNDIDEEFKMHQPIFEYIAHERQNLSQTSTKRKYFTRQKLVIYSSIAAVALVIIIVSGLFHRQHQVNYECVGTFVMIDGICYSDLSLVREHALKALDQVASSQKGIYKTLDFLDDIYPDEENEFSKE